MRVAGVDMHIEPLLPDSYVTSLSVGGLRGMIPLAKRFGRRVAVLRSISTFDVVYIQMEALPFLPAALEEFLLSSSRYVLDYDDAWFHRYDRHPSIVIRSVLRNKISSLMRRAAGVVVGSRYLYDYASQYNSRVVLVPTSIDLSRYPLTAPSHRAAHPIVGWIGSPSTTPHLLTIVEALRKVVQQLNAHVRIIGARPGAVSLPNTQDLPWSSSTEIELLKDIDVGIMPLPDEPFTRGKCAFKLIQYMGCWKPVVASPVGENNFVVEHEKNGFLAHTTDEWVSSIRRLIENPDLAARLGSVGRSRVASSYTLEAASRRVASFLGDCA